MLLLYTDPSGLISNSTFQAAMGAAKALVSTAIPTCLNIAFSMLAVQLFFMITQAIVFQKGWNLDPPLKILALIFFITFYNELAYSIVWTADTVSNLFEIKKDILAALGKITTGDIVQKHETSLGFMGTLPYDDFSSFVAWLMSIIQEGLSMIIRILISRMQTMLVAFMYVAGVFAAMLATLPGLGGSFLYWLKNLLQVLFWSLSLAILDNLIVFFLKSYQPDTADAMIDLVVLNLAIILMYISVPVLSSLYIGHAAVNSLMSRMSGVAGGMLGGMVGAAAKSSQGDSFKNMYSSAKDKVGNFFSKNSASRNS